MVSERLDPEEQIFEPKFPKLSRLMELVRPAKAELQKSIEDEAELP